MLFGTSVHRKYFFVKISYVNFFQPMALHGSLFQYDPSVGIKYSLTFDFFTNAIRGMGTGKHYDYIEAIEEGRVSIGDSMSDKL